MYKYYGIDRKIRICAEPDCKIALPLTDFPLRTGHHRSLFCLICTAKHDKKHYAERLYYREHEPTLAKSRQPRSHTGRNKQTDQVAKDIFTSMGL